MRPLGKFYLFLLFWKLVELVYARITDCLIQAKFQLSIEVVCLSFVFVALTSFSHRLVWLRTSSAHLVAKWRGVAILFSPVQLQLSFQILIATLVSLDCLRISSGFFVISGNHGQHISFSKQHPVDVNSMSSLNSNVHGC